MFFFLIDLLNYLSKLIINLFIIVCFCCFKIIFFLKFIFIWKKKINFYRYNKEKYILKKKKENEIYIIGKYFYSYVRFYIFLFIN